MCGIQETNRQLPEQITSTTNNVLCQPHVRSLSYHSVP